MGNKEKGAGADTGGGLELEEAEIPAGSLGAGIPPQYYVSEHCGGPAIPESIEEAPPHPLDEAYQVDQEPDEPEIFTGTSSVDERLDRMLELGPDHPNFPDQVRRD